MWVDAICPALFGRQLALEIFKHLLYTCIVEGSEGFVICFSVLFVFRDRDRSQGSVAYGFLSSIKTTSSFFSLSFLICCFLT